VEAGRVADVIVNWVGVITISVVADVAWAGLLLSVTVAVKVELPLTVGMPEITPVVEARVSPAGSLPDAIDQE
jgi:hypothetical protein